MILFNYTLVCMRKDFCCVILAYCTDKCWNTNV